MHDALREELATLGQRLELNNVERSDIVGEIAVCLHEHRDQVSVTAVANLTTLSAATLHAILEHRCQP